MICGCERHKEINADQFLGSEAVPLMIRLFRCGGR
jgi:hypothetical protein